MLLFSDFLIDVIPSSAWSTTFNIFINSLYLIPDSNWREYDSKMSFLLNCWSTNQLRRMKLPFSIFPPPPGSWTRIGLFTMMMLQLPEVFYFSSSDRRQCYQESPQSWHAMRIFWIFEFTLVQQLKVQITVGKIIRYLHSLIRVGVNNSYCKCFTKCFVNWFVISRMIISSLD